LRQKALQGRESCVKKRASGEKCAGGFGYLIEKDKCDGWCDVDIHHSSSVGAVTAILAPEDSGD
jgi:hypothetical protein